MKILLYGLGKTGTSALAYAIHKAMEQKFTNAALYFEHLKRPEKETENCIVKTLFDNPYQVIRRFNEKEAFNPLNNILDYSDYDKIVITVRCKRDRIISMFLYSFFSGHGMPKETFFKSYVQILAKEAFGNEISFTDLVNEVHPEWLAFMKQYYELYNKHIAEAVNKLGKKVYFIAYEDIYNKNFTELNKFLDLNVNDTEITDQNIKFRVKRSGESEQWKRWFNKFDRETIFAEEYPECNEYLPLLPEQGSQYLKKIGPYDSDYDTLFLEDKISILKQTITNLNPTCFRDFPAYFINCLSPVLKKSYPDIIDATKVMSIYNPDLEQKHVNMSVNINYYQQIVLLIEMFKTWSPPPWSFNKNVACRYFYNNDWFGSFDASILSFLIQKHQPEKILEIGSGFSTAVILDTIQQNDLETTVVCIDPNFNRLNSVVSESDKITSYNQTIQKCFAENQESILMLKENDILLFDGSHMFEPGSDVDCVINQILPLLNKGVLIHIHDIFDGFEYPESWQDRGWNECPYVGTWLKNNQNFEIVFFNNFIQAATKNMFAEKHPAIYNGGAGSLWLVKK